MHTSRTAVTEVMRIAWRTVGAICARVAAERRATIDPFALLRRIGIDEISYKRATATSRSSSTTTPGAWSGPGPVMTSPRWSPSSSPSTGEYRLIRSAR